MERKEKGESHLVNDTESGGKRGSGGKSHFGRKMGLEPEGRRTFRNRLNTEREWHFIP